MVGTKFLSELVDVAALQTGKLNIIKAPTGSGKTYFALQHIPSLTEDAVHDVVYLIDTINGKEQILQNYNAISEYRNWHKEVEEGGIWFDPSRNVVVITYAKFGVLIDRNPQFYEHFSYIICDEIHNLLKFQYFCHRPNYHSIARSGLENAVKGGSATVIALTATPNTISNEFHAPAVEIPIDQTELIHYEVGQTVCYTNLDAVLSEVEVGSVGLCYLSRISQMKAFEEQARKAGFSPVSIWSINNTDHKMTETQLEARNSILKEATIPKQYDLLIINSSSETSLKIKSNVDYVIVHSANPDTQVQVRGRVNSDLKTLYLPMEGPPTIRVPEVYIGRKLFTQDKRELIAALNLRNANNRPYGWTTIKSLLIDNEYSVAEGRSNNLRYTIIEPAADG